MKLQLIVIGFVGLIGAACGPSQNGSADGGACVGAVRPGRWQISNVQSGASNPSSCGIGDPLSQTTIDIAADGTIACDSVDICSCTRHPLDPMTCQASVLETSMAYAPNCDLATPRQYTLTFSSATRGVLDYSLTFDDSTGASVSCAYSYDIMLAP